MKSFASSRSHSNASSGRSLPSKNVYETSLDGRSTITMRYKVRTDTTAAYVDLYTGLLGNRGVIPVDASDPVVSRIDGDDVPVVVLTLASASRDEASLRENAYRLSDTLSPVRGVGALTLYGRTNRRPRRCRRRAGR